MNYSSAEEDQTLGDNNKSTIYSSLNPNNMVHGAGGADTDEVVDAEDLHQLFLLKLTPNSHS